MMKRVLAAVIASVILLVSPGSSVYAQLAQNIRVKAPVNAGAAAAMRFSGAYSSGRLDAKIGNLGPVLKLDMRMTGVSSQQNSAPAALLVSAANAANAAEAVAAQQVLTISAGVATAGMAFTQDEAVTEQSEWIAAGADKFAVAPARLVGSESRIRKVINGTLSLFSSRSQVPALEGVDAKSASSRSVANLAKAYSGSVADEKSSGIEVVKNIASQAESAKSWMLPTAALTAAFYGLDHWTKQFALKSLDTVFHECSWRGPLIVGIIPMMFGVVYAARAKLAKTHKVTSWSAAKIMNGRLGFYREEVAGLDDMMKEHPSLKWARRIFDVSIALMLGGLLGNGLDAIFRGGALDWIPLGRSMLNMADVILLPGLALFQLLGRFFVQAGKAYRAAKPLQFSTVNFLGLPLLGFFIAWAFGSAASDVPLSLAMKNVGYLYIMGFSMLIGISRFLAALVVDPFVKRFQAEQGKK
ncbi:MAG: hypothetical protein WC881_03405 [Elusimicrobiota bacterium]|jgi:lipoprotein signal peptidase